MAKRHHQEEDSDGTIAAEEEYYTLFIDTSLGTHLATIISDSATVSDVKKKIVLEHSQLFPRIGEIKILSLQVKRQGHFYHLPDSMFVVSAYVGSKRHKTLFVEASAPEDTCEPKIKRRSSSEASDHEIVGVETTPDHASESVPSIVKKRQKAVCQDLMETSPSGTNTIPGAPRTPYSEPAPDISHLLLPSEEVAVDPTAELGGRVDTTTSAMKHQITRMEDLNSLTVTSFHDKNKGASEAHDRSIHLASLESVANQTDNDGPLELVLHSDRHVMPSGSCKPSDQNDADRTTKELTVSPKVLETSYSMESLISDGTKKKKRAKKKVSRVQNSSVGEQSKSAGANSTIVPNLASENIVFDNADKNESAFPLVENDKSNIEVEKSLSSNCDLEEKLSKSFKFADDGEAEVTNQEIILSADLWVPSEAMEAVHSIGIKTKKKKIKKSAAEIEDKAKMEEELNTVSSISPLVQDVASHNEMTDNDNKSRGDLHSTEVGQATKIAGENGVSLQCGSTVIMRTVSNPLDLGDENANKNNSATTVVTSVGEDLKSGSQLKKRRTKKSAAINQDNSCMEQSNAENGISSVTYTLAKPIVVEAMNAQRTLTQDVGKKTSASMDVPVLVVQREGEKVIQNQEVLLPPTDLSPNQENTADMDDNVSQVVKGNQSEDDDGAANEKLVTGQPNDVQGPVLDQLGRHQGNDSRVSRKEKKKRKKSQISAAENLSNSEMKEQNFGVEELAASGTLTKDVGKKTSESIDVSASVAHREGEKFIQNQEELLPPTDVYLNQENTADMDENARDVLKNNQSRYDSEDANELLVRGRPNDVQDPVPDELGRHQGNDSSVNRKEKKKRKKGQNSAAEHLLTSEIKEQNFVAEELAASGDVWKCMNGPSKTTKIRKSTKRGTVVQSTDPHFEIEKNARIELGGARPDPTQMDTTSAEVPLNGRPETEIKDESNSETAKGADEGIDFRHYFVGGESQNDIGSSVKVKEASQSVKPKKKKEKRNAVPESTMKLSGSHGKGKSSDGTVASDKNLAESTDKQNKELPLGNKKISKDGAISPASNDVAGSRTLEKAMKPAIASRFGGSRAAPSWLEARNGSSTPPGLSSRSESPGEVVQNASIAKQLSSFNHNAMSTGKGSSGGNLLKSTRREKSLLTTERKLFTGSVSSSDENNMLNSDSSTQTPSENSSSSDSSTGESDSRQDSKRTASENAKTKGGAGKNVSSKTFFGSQHMSMDMVLRSSSRFKKAKLTASQSKDVDTESWPDDFVPDSQANVFRLPTHEHGHGSQKL